MQKLRAFFYVYIKSLTSRAYYKDLITARGWFTVKYFIALSFFLAIVLTAKTAVQSVPAIQKAINEIVETGLNMFPEDLVITVKDNVWALNKPEPFIVPIPAMANEDSQTSPKEYQQGPKNLLVLYNAGTVEDLETYDTYILINAKNILTRESTGMRANAIGELPNGEFKKDDFRNFMSEVSKITRYVPYVVVPLILIGLFLFFALLHGSNVYVLAVPVWLLGMGTKLAPRYSLTLKVTAHAATLPMTVYTITELFSYKIPVPFWFSALNIAYAVAAVVVMGRSLVTTGGNKSAGDDKSTDKPVEITGPKPDSTILP